MIKGFAPIVAKQPKLLIVGSMPSVTSLDKHEYYGFKHNRFWVILAQYFHCDWHSYADKISCIKDKHIVLWDVIESCEREGSLDSNIKKEKVNDIASLLASYPSITTVLCNGKKSYDLFQKHFSHLSVTCVCMPSTSNANRSITQDVLFEKWFDALDKYLL